MWLSVIKNPPANAGDAGDVCSIPGLGRLPGEGNGYPLQYFHQGNPMDRGACQATVHELLRVRNDFMTNNNNKKCEWLVI